jgi:glycine cleavage system aminomethyltransferase T
MAAKSDKRRAAPFPYFEKFIAIGTVESQYAALGAQVNMEITVEFARHQAAATIVKTPFLIRR